MKTPIFGFDIDDVVFDSYAVISDLLEKEFGIIRTCPPLSYNLEKECALTSSQTRWLVDTALTFNDKIKPISGALDFINKYHIVTKRPIIFMTSRPTILKQHTHDLISGWLKAIPYEVHFPNAEGRTKGDAAKEKNIEVFVDDRIKYCLQISKSGLLALMMSRSWNHSFVDESCSHRIVQVKNWNDVSLIFGTLLHYNR